MTAQDDPLPASGGTFYRQPDGSLISAEEWATATEIADAAEIAAPDTDAPLAKSRSKPLKES